MTDIGDEMKRQYEIGALAEHTWAPVIFPIQILILEKLPF